LDNKLADSESTDISIYCQGYKAATIFTFLGSFSAFLGLFVSPYISAGYHRAKVTFFFGALTCQVAYETSLVTSLTSNYCSNPSDVDDTIPVLVFDFNFRSIFFFLNFRIPNVRGTQ